MKQIKRSFLFAFLALMLALSPPVFAQAQDAFLFDGHADPPPSSVAIVDDMLYAMTHLGLYAHSLSDGSTRQLFDIEYLDERGISIGAFLFADEQLTLFDPNHQMIWAYDGQGLTKRLDLNGSLLDDPTVHYTDPVCVDGALFLLARDENASIDESRLIRLRLEDADAQILSVQGVTQLGTYKDGHLLALRQVNRAGAFYEIVAIDAQTLRTEETLATLPGFADQGVAFDSETGTLYAITGGELCFWEEGIWKPIRILPIDYFTFYYDVVDGRYAIVSQQGVGLYDLLRFRGRFY